MSAIEQGRQVQTVSLSLEEFVSLLNCSRELCKVSFPLCACFLLSD